MRGMTDRRYHHNHWLHQTHQTHPPHLPVRRTHNDYLPYDQCSLTLRRLTRRTRRTQARGRRVEGLDDRSDCRPSLPLVTAVESRILPQISPVRDFDVWRNRLSAAHPDFTRTARTRRLDSKNSRRYGGIPGLTASPVLDVCLSHSGRRDSMGGGFHARDRDEYTAAIDASDTSSNIETT